MMGDFHFRGPHRFLSWHKAAEVNIHRVYETCAPIIVTPKDLAETVNEEGVDAYRAKLLVERLLTQAKDEAFAMTIGVSWVTGKESA